MAKKPKIQFFIEDAKGKKHILDNYIEAVNESMKIKAAHFRATGERRTFPVEILKPRKKG